MSVQTHETIARRYLENVLVESDDLGELRQIGVIPAAG